MPWSLLVFPVLVPFLFWAAYHYYHDRHRPEPLLNLIICILLGVAAAYLNRFMYVALDYLELRRDAQLLTDNLPALFTYAVLVIGLTEELAKLLPFLLVVLRFDAFDEPLDGIVYGSFIALGFSVIENLHFASFLTQTELIARGFAAPLVHIVFASVWAYHVGLAHLAQRSVLRASIFWLAWTALLHGVYDFIVLGFSNSALVVAALVIVGVWVWRLTVIRRLNLEGGASASSD